MVFKPSSDPDILYNGSSLGVNCPKIAYNLFLRVLRFFTIEFLLPK